MVEITPEIQLWCSSQPVSIIQWLISPFFIFFLIYTFIFTPLGIIGIINIYHRIRNWTRIRAGWLKVRKKLSNLHWVTFWVKPTGRKANIKTEEGIEIELPLDFSEGMIGLEKEINSTFKSDKKPKEEKKKTVLDIHVKDEKPTKEEIEYAYDVLRRMVR